MDDDRLTPQLGRLIDAAKAAAARAGAEGGAAEGGAAEGASAEGAPARAEGWAVLGEDGKVYPGSRLAGAFGAAQRSRTSPEAAAFAVAGESGDTVLPAGDWRGGAVGADPHLPVVVKYLGRWVVVTLEEIPGA
jgi:hypothetical protein